MLVRLFPVLQCQVEVETKSKKVTIMEDQVGP